MNISGLLSRHQAKFGKQSFFSGISHYGNSKLREIFFASNDDKNQLEISIFYIVTRLRVDFMFLASWMCVPLHTSLSLFRLSQSTSNRSRGIRQQQNAQSDNKMHNLYSKFVHRFRLIRSFSNARIIIITLLILYSLTTHSNRCSQKNSKQSASTSVVDWAESAARHCKRTNASKRCCCCCCLSQIDLTQRHQYAPIVKQYSYTDSTMITTLHFDASLIIR